jgi:hypothetical protein
MVLDSQSVNGLQRRGRVFIFAITSNQCLCFTQSSGHPALFSWGKSYQNMKLTIHLHLVSRLRMPGAFQTRPLHVFLLCATLQVQSGS